MSRARIPWKTLVVLAVAYAAGTFFLSRWVRAQYPPCCCVLGAHTETEPDFCAPEDCDRHHGDVE